MMFECDLHGKWPYDDERKTHLVPGYMNWVEKPCRARIGPRGCICNGATYPCRLSCSCYSVFSSGGCDNCSRYGSWSQRMRSKMRRLTRWMKQEAKDWFCWNHMALIIQTSWHRLWNKDHTIWVLGNYRHFSWRCEECHNFTWE